MKPFLTLSLLLVFPYVAYLLFLLSGLPAMFSDGGPLPDYFNATFNVWFLGNTLFILVIFILILRHLYKNHLKKAFFTLLHLFVPIILMAIILFLEYLFINLIYPISDPSEDFIGMSIGFVIAPTLSFYNLYRLQRPPAPSISSSRLKPTYSK